MNDSKPWYASKGIWGGIFAALVPLAGLLLHVNLTDAQVQELATDAALIGGAMAGIIAIIGRVKASMPIRGTQAAQTIQPKGP